MAGQEMTDYRSGQPFDQLWFFIRATITGEGWIFRFEA